MYISLEEAAKRGWKSKSAWKLAGQKLKNQPPVAVVYRKTEKSIGLSYRNQEYISTDGHGHYLLPAPDEYIDGRFVCNSWEVYSPEQVVSTKPQPRRRRQAEVGLYQPEGYQLPASISDQERPFAQWFLSHLYYHPLMKFRHDRWEHYVPCGSKFLETMMGRNYKTVIRKLLEAEKIDCDDFYRPGDQQIAGKCLGYRLQPHLRPAHNKWRWVPTRSNTLHKRISHWKARFERHLSPRQRFMLGQLRELTINGDAARALIPAIVQSRIPEWQKNIKSGRIKKSLDELQLEFTQQLSRQIEAIERGDWYLKPDAYGREHTNITNLTSELRQFLSYHGEPLENVDTANSQPIFLGLSIKNAIKQEQEVPGTDTPYSSAICVTKTEREQIGLPVIDTPYCSAFRAEKKEKNQAGLSVMDTPYCSAICVTETEEEQAELPVMDTPYCSAFRADDDDPVINEVDKYLQWCEEGIYDKLAIRTHQPRRKVKKDMFAGVLFSRENNWHNKTAVAFEKEFPYVRQQIRNMKIHGYQKVAHEMQRTEAAFMFTKVVPRLLQENPQMPIFTLHDSIVTTPHYSQYVQDVMQDEFRKLDINAKVRIEPCVQSAAA